MAEPLDPLVRISRICDEQPHDALEQIAQALGFVSTERDAAGQLKPRLTVLEQHAITTLNTIKAWLDDGEKARFPYEAREGIELVLMLAAARRKGVR
jgi:hypothetical protein